MYRLPAVREPCLEDIQALNDEFQFKCSQQELQEMTEAASDMTKSLQRVYEMVDRSTPLVKYPRTPGYRPLPNDNPHNAWAWRCDVKGSESGKLSGRTVAVKDNTALAGVPMRAGSRMLDNYIPELDATVVTRILDAGGHIIGKSTTEDLCFSGSSVLSVDGPVTNPHDHTRVSGGSSSGNAALLASGQVDVAVGADQGGSVRIPASLSGVVGFKPTFGLVPYTGAFLIDPAVDHLGPMARTVADCALLLEVMAGYDDGKDPRQHPNMVVPEYSKLIDDSISGKRIGLLKEGFEICTEDVVPDVVRQTAQRLTELGCSVKEISVPMHLDARHIYTATVGYASFACVFQNNGAMLSHKGYCSPSMPEEMFKGIKTHSQSVQPMLKLSTMFNTYLSRHYGHSLYTKGMNLVLELTKRYDEALQDVDVLIMPTVVHTAPEILPATASFTDLSRHLGSLHLNTRPFNLTGHPAISVNAGFTRDNGRKRLPIGIQIVGRKFDEVTVLQVAKAVEDMAPK